MIEEEQFLKDSFICLFQVVHSVCSW